MPQAPGIGQQEYAREARPRRFWHGGQWLDINGVRDEDLPTDRSSLPVWVQIKLLDQDLAPSRAQGARDDHDREMMARERSKELDESLFPTTEYAIDKGTNALVGNVLDVTETFTGRKVPGKRAYDESVKQLVRFIEYFKDRPKDQRRDRHRTPPTIPIPWDQTPLV